MVAKREMTLFGPPYAFILPTIEYMRLSAMVAQGITVFRAARVARVRMILSGGRLGAIFLGSKR